MGDLTGVIAKLDRAGEHLATLDASLNVWRNSEPYSIVGHHNPDKTEHRFYLAFKVAPDLSRWGLLIGDCVHNLRSALDHLTWQCALPNGDPPRWTEFPITKTSDAFFGTGGYGGRSGSGKIAGVKDATQRALFERLQPWQNPNGANNDSLWLIHELDREDKHRVLTPVLVLPHSLSANLIIEYADETTASKSGPPAVVAGDDVLQDGAEAFSLHFIYAPIKVQMKASFSLGVGLEYAGQRGGVTGTLGNLCQHARRVVEDFRHVL